jgi:8-oxo-dGTP diphosphatase
MIMMKIKKVNADDAVGIAKVHVDCWRATCKDIMGNLVSVQSLRINGWEVYVVRNRSSSILIENNKIALIKRVSENCVYYVFPGGGIEEGETPEETATRETFEELGVQIAIREYFGAVCTGTQYYFLADIVSGVFGTGQGEEMLNNELERGTYKPMWIDIKILSTIDVKPKEIVDKIRKLFN